VKFNLYRIFLGNIFLESLLFKNFVVGVAVETKSNVHPLAGFSAGAVTSPCHLTFWCSASSSARKRSVSRRVAPICVRGSCVARRSHLFNLRYFYLGHTCWAPRGIFIVPLRGLRERVTHIAAAHINTGTHRSDSWVQ